MLTDMKQTGVPNRTPFTMAQGGAGDSGRARIQTVKPVQTGNIGLTRPVMSNQDAAAAKRGDASAQSSGAAQMQQPVQAIQPAAPAASTAPVQSPIQPAPQSMTPGSLRGYSAEPVNPDYNWLRMSSVKNGSTPQQVDFSPSAPSAPSYGGENNSAIVRNALANMKNSEIMQLLVDISNGRIRGRADD